MGKFTLAAVEKKQGKTITTSEIITGLRSSVQSSPAAIVGNSTMNGASSQLSMDTVEALGKEITPSSITTKLGSYSTTADEVHTEGASEQCRDITHLEISSPPESIAYLRELQQRTPNANLRQFFTTFKEARSIDINTFTEGAKEFIKIANLSKQERLNLYNSEFGGLHYDTDLAQLCNELHTQKIEAHLLKTMAPSLWSYVIQDGYLLLTYKGNNPALALNALIQGPTAIDCAMFCQLSIWFGIRYMLGDQRFNQVFGRAPLFITQSIYQPIEHKEFPNIGNPLFNFLSLIADDFEPSFSIEYFTNFKTYPHKHPAGSDNGENSIKINGLYYIFNQDLEHIGGLSASEVNHFLLNAHNKEQDTHDLSHLKAMLKTKDKMHPHFHLTFEELIDLAEIYKDDTETIEALYEEQAKAPQYLIHFNINKFQLFLQQIDSYQQSEASSYRHISHSDLTIPSNILEQLPFENRLSMSFDNYKQDTEQQRDMFALSQQFCDSVMRVESELLILSGKAGVGKTAAAVCAAKELITRGKNIIWIAEVTVKGFADQARSIADLSQCEREVEALLDKNPDVIFLDDDNLTVFCGTMLLEKMYHWYSTNNGKSLFITSNENISFANCYSSKSGDRYYLPPFIPYMSNQYINQKKRAELTGDSLRTRQDGSSIGAIVTIDDYSRNEHLLITGLTLQAEYIPIIPEEKIIKIRRALRKNSLHGEEYETLRPIEKQWLYTFMTERTGYHHDTIKFGTRVKEIVYEDPYKTAIMKKFENSRYKTIVLEVGEYKGSIDYDSISQLLRVLNYAHDQGGRRVILINKTSFDQETFINKIKSGMPANEQMRSWSRLECLLKGNTALSIFQQTEFNGFVVSESLLEKRKAPSMATDVYSDQHRFFNHQPTETSLWSIDDFSLT